MPLTRTITRRSWTTRWKEERKKRVRDFSFFLALVKYFLRRLARSSHGSDITTAGNLGGGGAGADGGKEAARREKKRRAAWCEERCEGASEIREEGRANRANGQLAYLWRPYFRYMNWFPSKVRDAASFQFKMYREVSRRSPSTGRFATGHSSRAIHTSLIPSSHCRERASNS